MGDLVARAKAALEAGDEVDLPARVLYIPTDSLEEA
ncbi:hypothetical protein SEA_DONKEYKONG_84 [Mycobacterium phage Donkeykong]|nr:hypothetical protein I5H28_gp084 [Mycobacterium phage Donkeykong]QGJ90869.1 hypothetical protein SEA_DONKEYKONG_84 [Mycobacterium phage Donkeykong]